MSKLTFLLSIAALVLVACPAAGYAQSQPSLSIQDTSSSEGTDIEGARAAFVSVTLSTSSSEPVTVNYGTSNGTASAGSDYVSSRGTLTFPAGSTQQFVEVDLVPDGDPEQNETFTITLSSASGATIADGTGQVTIVDDDAGRRTISSSGPLERIYLENTFQCQVRYTGDAALEFYSSVPGSCGTSLWVGSTGFGHRNTAFTPVSQTGPTGSGTASNPFTVTSVADVGSTGLRITRVDRYVTGDDFYRSDVTISNTGSSALSGVLYHSADCYLQNSDSGYGFVDSSTGGVYCSANPHNQPAGRIEGFIPISSGSSFFEDGFSTVYGGINGSPFPNTCACDRLIDNGMGLSWNVSMPANGQTTRSFVTAFSPTGVTVDPTPDEPAATTPAPAPSASLALSPVAASLTAGQSHTVVAQAQNGSGPVRFFVNGANPISGVTSTDGAGRAAFTYPGANAGDDTIFAYLDLNGNGVQNSSEPSASATASWAPAQQPPRDTGLPPNIPTADSIDQLPDPEPFREVNVQPEGRGQVYVRLPRGSSSRVSMAALRKAQAQGAPKGFVSLQLAAQLPVGTTVDTSKGRVVMESAANTRGSRTQTARFYSGRFQMLQKRVRRRQPVTEMVLKGGSYRGCPRTRARRSDLKADASRSRRSRVRRLWGRGKGRFRTRGRYSSATVRGTTWLVEDQCGGTLTRLPRRPRTSRVEVRDLTRRKTVTLRAGQRYLAKAPTPRRR